MCSDDMTQIRTAGSRCHMSSISQWSSTWYSTTQACLHSPVPNTKCPSPAVFQQMTQHYPLEEGAGMEPLWLLILSVCSSVSSHIIFLYYVNHIIIIERVYRISLALLCSKNVDIVKIIFRPVACFLVNLLNVKAWTNVSFLAELNSCLQRRTVRTGCFVIIRSFFGLTVSSSIYL